MDVYCVKEKRFTPNVVGSEKITTAKNGRRLLKAKCASCGITKTRFVSDGVRGLPREGGNFLDSIIQVEPQEVYPKRKEKNLLALKRDYSEVG